MKKINILGSCVLRDAFVDDIVSEKYKISKFIQSQSVLSLLSPPLSDITTAKVLPEDMSYTNPVWYRWAIANLEKSVFKELKTNASDALIIGFEEILYELYRLTNKEGKNTIISTSVFNNHATNIFTLKKFSDLVVKAINPLEFIKTTEGKKYLDKCLKYIEENVLTLYSQKNIILVCYRWGRQYLAKNGEVENFYINENTSREGDELIEYCNEHFIKRVNPYVVKIPNNAICYAKHRWGLGKQHFIPEVYDYLYRAYEICFDNLIPNKEACLDKIYCEFEAYMKGYLKYNEIIQHSAKITPNVFSAYISGRIDLLMISEKPKYSITKISDEFASDDIPGWFQKSGLGHVIISKKMNIDIVVKVDSDGVLNLYLRSHCDIKDGRHTHIPYWIDYNKLIINNKNIFSDVKPCWHDRPYIYSINVMAGDILTFHVEWKPHRDERKIIDEICIPRNIYIVIDKTDNKIICHNIPLGIRPENKDIKCFWLNGNEIIENVNNNFPNIYKPEAISHDVSKLFKRINTKLSENLMTVKNKGIKIYYYSPNTSTDELIKDNGVIDKFIASSVKYSILLLLHFDYSTLENCKDDLMNYIGKCEVKYSAHPQILAKISNGVPLDVLQNCDYVISEGKIEDIVASDYAVNFGAETVMADSENLFHEDIVANVRGGGTK